MSFYQEDFQQLTALKRGTYEQCTFSGCQLASADLSEIQFEECVFTDCDLSGASVYQTGFKNVVFKGCKLLGLRFDDCNPFLLELRFEHCQLDFSFFTGMQLSKTVFQSCTLREADFTNTNLTAAKFPDSDLALTIFEHTNLEQADLSTARNFLIKPEQNRLKKARFSIDGLYGLVSHHEIEINELIR